MYITPEKNWKRKTRLAFILFCFCSLALIGEIIPKIKAAWYTLPSTEVKSSDTDITNVVIIWIGSLLAWLGFRWYYRLLKKNNKNSLS